MNTDTTSHVAQLSAKTPSQGHILDVDRFHRLTQKLLPEDKQAVEDFLTGNDSSRSPMLSDPARVVAALYMMQIHSHSPSQSTAR